MGPLPAGVAVEAADLTAKDKARVFAQEYQGHAQCHRLSRHRRVQSQFGGTVQISVFLQAEPHERFRHPRRGRDDVDVESVVRQIAEIVGCSRQTVLHQISRYEQEGISGLADKPRSGARAKANREYIAQLKKAVASDPRELGYRFSVWSVERLQRHLHQQTEVELAPKYLAELMKKHEIVYRKPKHDLAHKRDRQEVEEKKELLEFLKKTL